MLYRARVPYVRCPASGADCQARLLRRVAKQQVKEQFNSHSSKWRRYGEAPSSPSSPVVAPFPDEVIEQKGSNVTITTKGPFDNVIEFTADGAEEVTDLGSGGAQRALLAYWDGNKLVTKMTMVRDGQIILQVKEVRYLLDGGKEMIVEKHAKMAQGEGDFHIVMNRKS